MKVTVIIVNYNTANYLIECLNSINKYSKGVDLIVVDNNSPQRDIENVSSLFPNVKFYFRDVNDGFGAGCNFGAAKSDPSSRYLFFVNPDIVFINDTLACFYDYMERNPGVGVCTGLLIDGGNEILYSYNYDMNLRWELMGSFDLGIKRFKKKLVSREEIKKGIPFEIDWALGAFLFIRKDVFNSVGGFDEDFFLYTEDNDLQYRIRKKGFKVVCLPFERVVHYYGSSMNDPYSKTRYNYYFYSSKIIYAYKHFSFFKRNLLRIILITGLILRIFKYIFWTGKDIKIIGEQIIPALRTTVQRYEVKPDSND